MKKISLKKLNLKEVEKLSREQLKNILGGWADGSETETGGETSGCMCGCDDGVGTWEGTSCPSSGTSTHCANGGKPGPGPYTCA